MSESFDELVDQILHLVPPRIVSSAVSLPGEEYDAYMREEEGYRWEAARRVRAERIVRTLRPDLACPSCYMFGDHKMDCSYR